MAVQKSKCTRSKQGMRRSHHIVATPNITTDKCSGEKHRRHHITNNGFYLGNKIL